MVFWPLLLSGQSTVDYNGRRMKKMDTTQFKMAEYFVRCASTVRAADIWKTMRCTRNWWKSTKGENMVFHMDIFVLLFLQIQRIRVRICIHVHTYRMHGIAHTEPTDWWIYDKIAVLSFCDWIFRANTRTHQRTNGWMVWYGKIDRHW